MAEDPIKVVCFELPGVLVETVSGWEDALRRAGVDVKEHRVQRLVRNPGISEANNLVEIGKAPADQFIRVLSYVSGYETSEIRAAMTQWHVDLYKGVEELLQDLVDHDIRLAVLANTNNWYWNVFETDERYAPLRRHILHRFASFLIGDRKPSLDAYDPVDTTFGVSPESVLLFDNDSLNVDAARSLKWNAQLITPGESPVKQMADKLRELGWLDYRPAGEGAPAAAPSGAGPAVQAEGAMQVNAGLRGAPTNGSDATPAAGGSSNGDHLDAGLIDVHQLRRMAKSCGWTPEQLAERYIRKAGTRLMDLEDALSRREAAEVFQLAYAWGVSSASCGMVGMVDLMHQMREAGLQKRLDATDMLFTKVQLQHQRIQESIHKI